MKQQKLLVSFSQQQLLDIINSLIESDKNIKEKLIQNWLTPPEQQVKNLEKAYNKIFKRVDNSKSYFDYYKSDAIFDEYH